MKTGLKIGDTTVDKVYSPEQAIKLIEKVVAQFQGDKWTQSFPKCPLCNNHLEDSAKHMLKPVGECVHETCKSTIFPSDYFGKIQAILDNLTISLQEKEAAEKKKSEKTKVSCAISPGKVAVDTTKIYLW